MTDSLHQQIRKKAANGLLMLETLKPNSRMIAQRMIAEGELIKSGNGYILNEMGKKK